MTVALHARPPLAISCACGNSQFTSPSMYIVARETHAPSPYGDASRPARAIASTERSSHCPCTISELYGPMAGDKLGPPSVSYPNSVSQNCRQSASKQSSQE